MATGVRDLGITEFGVEAAKGTAVAGTTRQVGSVTFTPMEEVLQPQPQIGIMAENPTSDAIVKRWTDINWSGELTYEQIIHLLEMSIDGGQTGVGGAADKTWTYQAAVAADPVLKSFTMRKRYTDGATNWDEVAAYCMARGFKLSGALGETIKYDADIFGRPIDRALALSGAAVPSVNFVSVPDVKLFIDDTAGAIGGRQIAEALVGWDMDVRTQVHPKFFQDGRIDRSFTNYGIKRFGMDFKAQCEVNDLIMNTASGERQRASTRAIRYCRLVATGAALGGSNYKVQIDFTARYRAGMFDADGGDREGNDTIPLDLISVYDSANPTLLWKATIVNALTAVP